MKSLVLALVLALGASVGGLAPVWAAEGECADPTWPSFTEVAETAHSIYLAKVTESADGIATRANAREVMRGGAPGKVDLRTLRPGSTDDACPEPPGPYAEVGDRLLIAYDGTAADRAGSIDAVARVGQQPEGLDATGLEWLTLKQARAYERIKRRVPVIVPTPTPAQWSPRPSQVPATADEGAVLWSCGGGAPGFPLAVLDGPAGVETMEGPVFDGLRSALETMRGEFEYEPREDRPDALPWLLAYEDDDRALFLVRRTSQDEHYSVMYVERDGGTWGFSGYGDLCGLRPLITHEHGESVWRVRPKFPPTPESTTIEVKVMERECASGRKATGRIAEPIVDYSEEAVTITIPVRRVTGGADCQGNPWTPYVLELDEPIGDRVLLDGGPWPPEQRWPVP